MSDYLTQRELLDSVIPVPQIESIVLETQGQRTLVKVSYSISDVVHNDEISTWFDSVEYEKYFRLRMDVMYDADGVRGVLNIPSDDFQETSIRYRLADGSFADKFMYNNDISIPSDNIRALSIVLTSGFDVESLEQDYDIELFNEEEEREAQKTVHADLIKDHRVSYPLQDFRTLTTSQSLYSPNSDVILGEYRQRYQQAKTKLESEIEERGQFISDLWLSRNARNHANIFFIIDPMSYYENQSEYRHIFKNFSQDRKNALVSSMKFDYLQIMRKRVRVNDTGLGKFVIDYPDSDKPNKTLIVTTDKKDNESTFRTNRSSLGAVRQIELALDGIATFEDGNLFQDYFGGFQTHKLYFITASDYEVSELSDGKYSYGVRLGIKDGVREMLLEEVRNMHQSVSSLHSILEVISSEENYDKINNVYKKPYNQIITPQISFNEHITLYEDMLNLVSIDLEQSERIKNFLNIFKKIPIRLSPSSPPELVKITPQSVATLIETIDGLAKMIVADLGESSSFLQKVVRGRSVVSSNFDPSFPSPHPSPCYEYEKYYDSVSKLHDANIPSRTGIDYLSNFDETSEEIILREISSLADQDVEHIGLSVIDGARFEQRMTTEILTYFESTTTTPFYPALTTTPSEVQIPVSVTGFGSEYLSPSYASDSGDTIPLLGNSSEDASLAFTDLVVMRETVPSTRSSSREGDFFAKLNTVCKKQEEFTSIIYDDLGRQSFSESSIDRVPEIDSQLQDLINHENLVDDEYKRDFQKFLFSKFKKIIKTPFLGTERTLENSEFPEQEYQIIPNNREEFSTLPNFLRSSNAASQLVAKAYINRNFMAKIQYLQGFDNITFPDRPGYKSVLKPQWASLSLDEYRANATKNLLCRIAPYERTDLGIRVANTGLPIYDAFFIIKPVSNPTVEAPNYRIVDITEGLQEQADLIANARTSLISTLTQQRDDQEGHLVICLLAVRVSLELFNTSRRTLAAEIRLLRLGYLPREKFELAVQPVRILGFTEQYKAALRVSGLSQQEIDNREQRELGRGQSALIEEWNQNEPYREVDPSGVANLAGDNPDIFRTQFIRNQVAERRTDLRNALNTANRFEKELRELNRRLMELGA